MLYSARDLIEATGGRAGAVALPGVTGVSIDSRDMPEGGLFAAILGVSRDGHDFVRAAVGNGAAVAMVSEARAGDFADLPILIVPDVLDGLKALGRHARARSAARIVAVTGSAGKTTTKEAIRLVLSGFGATHASIRSFNNHWGVPLMLARMPPDTRFGVFELGMNHAGEIGPLSRLVRPHVAVVTNIAQAHLEALGSLEAIATAKAEIFEGLAPGGTAILNADHRQIDQLTAAARAAGVGKIVTYGFSSEAEVRIGPPRVKGWGQVANVTFDGHRQALRLTVAGRHMLANAVAALSVARALGLDLPRAAAQLSGFGAGEGRGAVLSLGRDGRRVEVIDESYNANPASMEAALAVFASRQAIEGRKLLVLGDMLELGAQSAELHAGLKRAVAGAGADLVFLVGPRMQALAEALGPGRVAGWGQGVADIEGPVLNALANGDVVMIKGSNGVRLSALVARIRQEFGGDGAS